MAEEGLLDIGLLQRIRSGYCQLPLFTKDVGLDKEITFLIFLEDNWTHAFPREVADFYDP